MWRRETAVSTNRAAESIAALLSASVSLTFLGAGKTVAGSSARGGA